MNVGRQRTTSTGLPPNLYQEGERFRFRDPTTGRRTWLGTDRAAAVDLAQRANTALKARAAARQANPAITIGHAIDMYCANVVPTKPWDTGTRRNAVWRLRVLQAEMGDRPIASADRVFLGDWLARRAKGGDLYNKWRERLVDLWVYAIARAWCDVNEAAATMKRSTSAKLAANRRQRQRLELADFWAIHDHPECPPWLQVAIEQSLITLQSRQEIVSMRLSDYRDGWLYVVRDKVAGDSDMAFIRIAVGPQLEDIKRRAMADGVLTDYLVHRRPERDRVADRVRRPHWAAVRPEYLSKAFQAVRDATGRWASLPARARPTFHEIRSLGARTYRALGYPEQYIQVLMTHADKTTTAIYLAGGQITDDHYHKVEAGLRLETLR